MAQDALTIAQYIRFRFRDRTGAIVTIGSGMGTFMYFSSNEILGTIVEASRYKTQVLATYQGYAASVPVPQPRRFDLTINTNEAATFEKLRLLNEFIGAGYRVEFWILSGYFTYSATTDDLAPNTSSPIFAHAIVEYADGESRHTQMKRGVGLIWKAETPIRVYEGRHYTVPAQPTAPTQDDEILTN